MFYKLKKNLILSYFEKKKIKEPFDMEAAERHELASQDDINMNNSHFFTASSAAGEGETLSIRLGMRNHSDYEIFVLYRKGPLFLTHEKDSYAPAECPVHFERLESGKRWRTTFNGRLKNQATGETVDASIDVEFNAEYPIYDFIYHADQFNGMAESIAREKWNKKFFAELGKNNQRHYEQAGHLAGSICFGGQEHAIDLPCVRDHSFGRREWDMMNDHIWLLAITEDGRVLSYSIVNYPAMKRIYSGYTNLFSNQMQTLRDVQTVHYEQNGGLGGDTLKLRCIFPEGNEAQLSLLRDANVKCSFGGGKFVFQEGLCEFEINGLKARGTIEYGFNADPSRWEGF